MKELELTDQGMKLELSIEMDQAQSLRPNAIYLQLQSYHEREARTLKPFPYFSDALASLSGWKLWSYLPKSQMDSQLSQNLSHGLHNLDTHFALFRRSQARLASVTKVSGLDHTAQDQSLKHNFKEILQASWKQDHFKAEVLSELADSISFLEDQIGVPIVYNFSKFLSSESRTQWLTLLSFLYNIRALVATDFNAHCLESAFDGIKLDPVSDYLPKAEYVVNDALLIAEIETHWMHASSNMKQNQSSFDQLHSQMDDSFRRFAHNSYCLYHSLPSELFLKGSLAEREEGLYQVQLDWLFGSDAGLLFRVREELYGLKEGYGRLFWLDAPAAKPSRPDSLEVSCLLKPEHYLQLNREDAA